jgi:hypothetical protein
VICAIEAPAYSPNDTLLSILSAVCKLLQAILIDVVDLLAHGTCRVSGVVGGNHHVAMTFAAHDAALSIALELSGRACMCGVDRTYVVS